MTMLVSRRASAGRSRHHAGVSAPLPLENGARLGVAEYLRRYEAMPEVKKAELIQGVVHMAPPVSADHHGIPDNLIQVWLGTYAASTPGVVAAANATVRLDGASVPQPDVLLMIDGPLGSARRGRDGYIVGAPELIAEVAASTATIDLHDKLDAYRKAGVREYIVWCTMEKQFFWFALSEGEYVAMKPDKKGILHSTVFPGLCLDVKALMSRKAAKVLAALTESLNTDLHRKFVSKLKRKR